jgi:hypothetical protein
MVVHRCLWTTPASAAQGPTRSARTRLVFQHRSTGHAQGTEERSTPMLWTILIVLIIIALVIWIVGRMRGGRGV